MKIKSFLAKPFAGYVYKQIKKGMETALEDQQSIFEYLLKAGSKTEFGKEHGFSDIKTYQDFIRQVPIRDYEAFKPYIEKIKQGKHNVLWKGQPLYFAKTSGTTSGVKYIPIKILSAIILILLVMRCCVIWQKRAILNLQMANSFF